MGCASEVSPLGFPGDEHQHYSLHPGPRARGGGRSPGPFSSARAADGRLARSSLQVAPVSRPPGLSCGSAGP